MRTTSFSLLFLGTSFTAAGCGATFLLTEHSRSLGGGEIETGWTLAEAAIRILVGVPLVGWFGERTRESRLAAFGALLGAIGCMTLAEGHVQSPAIGLSGFLVGLGWGVLFLAASTALSHCVTDADRGF